MQIIQVDITYDFICPWCWIGQRNFATALEHNSAGKAVSIRYVPFELNPTMPIDGMDRRVYRTRKFGNWARSQTMDAQVAAAGQAVGARFNYSIVQRTPNTRLAHRLMQFAQARDEPQMTAALYESIYAAYFSDGLDIGMLDALLAIAAGHGFDENAIRLYLTSNAGNDQINAARQHADSLGVRTVPTFVIGGEIISGAQPPEVFAQALRSAAIGSAA